MVVRVRIEIPRVVEVVVHDGEALLIGRRALAEVTVPAAVPGVILIRPGERPGARIAADRRRAAAVDVRVGLEVAGPRLEAHDAVLVWADTLAFAEPRLHDECGVSVRDRYLREHERRDAVAVVHAAALRHLG